MSKISLTPNASGTGTFTIASPDSNTNRTLTLPDADGALLTANGDGSSLTGIDTSPPTTAGVVGTYGFFKNTADVNINFGSTLSGSSLVPSNAIGLNYSSPTVSGTWMAVGDSNKQYTESLTTVWLRIS